jgi:hypothetical protein
MNKYTNILMSVILVVVVINLVLTCDVYIRQSALVNSMIETTESLDSTIANIWGEVSSEHL